MPHDPHALPEVLDAHAVNVVVKRSQGSFKRCYEAALRRDPDGHGAPSIRFTIGPDGQVTEASATGTSDKGLETCLVAAMKRMVFPKPADGASVQVAYPFR